MKILLVCLGLCFLSACSAPQMTKETADALPPLTLCQEYKKWSGLYTSGGGSYAYSEGSMRKNIETVYSAIKQRNIDCKVELSIDYQPSNKSKMVNCFPNRATGGVTCL